MNKLKKKTQILLVGYGDIAKRVAALGHHRFAFIGTSRSANCPNPDKGESLQATAIQRHSCATNVALRLRCDLDIRASLKRLGGLAQTVVMLAPPDTKRMGDLRSQHLAAALAKAAHLPQRFIYVSTTGVYGDQGGLWVDESTKTKPESERALRRVLAEEIWRNFCRRNGIALTILRVPGIYAQDRLPIERLEKQIPAIVASEDGYSNHIHADDLAAIILNLLVSPKVRGGRTFNTVDESDQKMGEYFDLVADSFGMKRAPRLSRNEIQTQVSPMQWSFMRESRRIVAGDKSRLVSELGVRLRYKTVADCLASVTTVKAA